MITAAAVAEPATLFCLVLSLALSSLLLSVIRRLPCAVWTQSWLVFSLRLLTHSDLLSPRSVSSSHSRCAREKKEKRETEKG